MPIYAAADVLPVVRYLILRGKQINGNDCLSCGKNVLLAADDSQKRLFRQQFPIKMLKKAERRRADGRRRGGLSFLIKSKCRKSAATKAAGRVWLTPSDCWAQQAAHIRSVTFFLSSDKSASSSSYKASLYGRLLALIKANVTLTQQQWHPDESRKRSVRQGGPRTRSVGGSNSSKSQRTEFPELGEWGVNTTKKKRI